MAPCSYGDPGARHAPRHPCETRVMTTRSLEEAPFLNFLDPEVLANPAPVYDDLRARTAVIRTPIGVAVLQREHVHKLLSDSRLVAAIPEIARMQGVTAGPLAELLGATVIAKDGPDHTRLRRLVARSFTPRSADRHRHVMQILVNELVDAFAPRGRCDFMVDFASRYPVQVICEVLGVPREDYPLFARWSETLTFLLSLDLAAHLQDVEQATLELASYIDRLLADRRDNPRDDLVTSLVHATEEGDRLSPLELRAMIGGLLFAGYDTTRSQLGLALFTFCQHPEQWNLLAHDETLASRAVDEVMRLAGAVTAIPRIAADDLEVDGWDVPAGTIVSLLVATANRDNAAYDDASSFDITADRASHLTFGGGPHYCLGANLARVEMEEAFRVLPRRLANLRLQGEPSWRQGTGISGPAYLPIEFDPTEAGTGAKG
jgi:cytochrome P450